LAVVLTDGRHLRLRDLTQDPRSVGFPPHHPPMRSLLATPILAQGRVYGNLYLTEKEGADAFSEDDAQTLERFATQAALAIQNAHLHQQVLALAVMQERERIAREMHDSLAQVLGYVNIKSQAAKEFLRRQQPEQAATQIDQLAQAARSSYNDVRENILGLRTSLDPERGFLDTLREYLARWAEQSDIRAELHTPPVTDFTLRLGPLAELQLLRIIQEALSNIRKHSGAAHATVELQEQEGWVVAAVTGDGAGFDPHAGDRTAYPRFGLSTMRERAEAVGGTWSIESAPGRGARVTVHIPVDAAAARGGNYARPDR
ncbi:MAG: GAF domain-containing sensor histidine kinase, partial [Chloroflexi bacterium]|nr:GAF domain-containing sensor histidine kinase [Chloroflexota bacterium]